LILKKHESTTLWDSQISDFSIKNINIEQVKKFMNDAKKSERINFDFETAETTLKKIGLLKRNRLLNAAKILFCDENSLQVQLAVLAGTDRSNFLDIKELRGTLLHILSESELYIKQHIRWRAEISGLERNEIPEIPVEAIRESLVNSLCHRDYFRKESNKIALYKDRLEIYNPGGFPENKTPEDYLHGDAQSILRNPLIAQILYYSRNIEKWGSGLKRIHNACEAQNIELSFKYDPSEFSVILHRPQHFDKSREEILKSLSTNERRVIELMIQDSRITRLELAKKAKLSPAAIDNNVAKLKEKRLLKRVGPKKGGHWKSLL